MEYLEEQRRVADDNLAVQEMQNDIQDKLEQQSMAKGLIRSQNPAATGQPPQQQPQPAQGGGGGDPQGGAPPTGSANQMQTAAQMALAGQSSIKEWQSVTPQDLLTYAQSIAQQIVTMDPVTRRQMLAQLRQSEPQNVYEQIYGELKRLDQQARTQGAAMFKQQMAQGGQPQM